MRLENYPLFNECLTALETNLLPEVEADRLSQIFFQTCPFTEWGRVDWDEIDLKLYVGYDLNGIIPFLETLFQSSIDTSVYIEWSRLGIPVIKTNLNVIIRHFDEVACVSSEKFIFNRSMGYIVEILRSGEIRVGILTRDMIYKGMLWDECLTALGNEIIILGYDKEPYLKVLKNRFGFGYECVAWNLIDKKSVIGDKDQIKPTIDRLLDGAIDATSTYIFWFGETLPIIKTTLDNAISNLESIRSMGSKIWIFNESAQYVIELAPDEIKVGLRPERKPRVNRIFLGIVSG